MDKYVIFFFKADYHVENYYIVFLFLVGKHLWRQFRIMSDHWTGATEFSYMTSKSESHNTC